MKLVIAALCCMVPATAFAGLSTITFGAGNTATESALGQAGLFNGAGANTFDAGGGQFGVEFSRANSSDWVAFENNGQFLNSSGAFSVTVENTGQFNSGQGETIASMDALNPNTGDWILRFERDTATTGQVLFRYQSDTNEFLLRSAIGAIAIGDVIDVAFEYGPAGVSLFVNGSLEDSSAVAVDFTQNINTLMFGSANWSATPGSFPSSETAIGSSLKLYQASFVPAPGAAGALALGGIVAMRRRR